MEYSSRRGSGAPGTMVSSLAMRRLRQARIPALILGLILSFAALLPEMGHSLAHRHAASHAVSHAGATVDDDHHHGAAAGAAHPHGDLGAADADATGAHLHFDLRPPPPTKASPALRPVARIVIELVSNVADTRRPSRVDQDHRLLAGRSQDPPPTSRAPPLS